LVNPRTLAVKPGGVMGALAGSTPLGALSLGGSVGTEGHRKIFISLREVILKVNFVVVVNEAGLFR
jgi:hypothetical protein